MKITNLVNQVVQFSYSIQLYKTQVRPHLEYGAHFSSPYYRKDAVKLERMQRRLQGCCQDSSAWAVGRDGTDKDFIPYSTKQWGEPYRGLKIHEKHRSSKCTVFLTQSMGIKIQRI